MRTGILPTMDEVIDEAITKTALQYVSFRDARLAALREEITVKDRLLELMKAKGLEIYHDGEENLQITIESKAKIKVKIGGDEENE